MTEHTFLFNPSNEFEWVKTELDGNIYMIYTTEETNNKVHVWYAQVFEISAKSEAKLPKCVFETPNGVFTERYYTTSDVDVVPVMNGKNIVYNVEYMD